MADANFASLSPTLLARKGGAKPAMRPQLGPIAAMGAQAPAPPPPSETQWDDLGWNDMGEEEPHGASDAESALIVPIAGPADTGQPDDRSPASDARRRQEELAASIANDPGGKPRAGTGKRAAFTLRLDAERHLKLRLASTVRGVSAQKLVTRALDDLLAEMPELGALAARIRNS